MYKGLKMTRVQCIPLNYPLVIQIVAEKVISKIFCRLFQFQQMPTNHSQWQMFTSADLNVANFWSKTVLTFYL